MREVEISCIFYGFPLYAYFTLCWISFNVFVLLLWEVTHHYLKMDGLEMWQINYPGIGTDFWNVVLW